MDLYIYYRVLDSHAGALCERVLHMQQQLRHTCGVTAELKRRPEPKAGYHTWMEVYLNVPANFDSILAEAVNAAGLGHLIVDARHCESFVGVSTCA